MKLLRCYIENFGGLRRYQLDFSPNLTTIKEPNGFGKSTLAAFVRAMFYGMPRSGKTLDRNDRKRYYPWQGGLYGGWVEFEHEYVQYRVERSFGLTPKQDTFKLYTLHPFAPSTHFSENLGEEIFQIGADSFERTTYLPQLHWGESFVTSELQAQLTNLIENTDDAGDFDTAVQSLKAQRSKYIPYRGKGGIVGQDAGRLSELHAQLADAEQSRQELAHAQSMLQIAEQNYQAKHRELDGIRKSITESYEAVSHNAMAEQYDALQAQATVLRTQQNRLRSQYPAGLPTEAELSALSDAVIRCEQAEAWTLSPSEQQQLDELEPLFESGVPTSEQLETLDMGLHTLYRLERDIQERSHALMQQHPEEKRIAPAVFLILTALFAIGGIGLYYYEMLVYCFAAVVNAGVCLGLACITGAINGRKYRKLRKQREKIDALQHSADSLREKLQNALGLYFDTEHNFSTVMNELSSARTLYLKLQEKAHQLGKQRTDHQADAVVLINEIFTTYGLTGISANRQGIAQLRSIREKWSALDTMAAQAEDRIARFEQTYGKPQFHTLGHTTDELKHKEAQTIAELDALQKTISQLHQNLLRLQSDADRCIILEDEITRLQEKQAADLAKVKALDKTIEHLLSARQALSGRFLEPLKKQFTAYLTQFIHIDADAVQLDTGFNVTLEQLGAQRELGYFSVGQVDMIALCLRFALVDVLFGDSSPLLILDDPFVNLDDENLHTAMKLLEQLSQTHQILYLTCHDSRTH